MRLPNFLALMPIFEQFQGEKHFQLRVNSFDFLKCCFHFLLLPYLGYFYSVWSVVCPCWQLANLDPILQAYSHQNITSILHFWPSFAFQMSWLLTLLLQKVHFGLLAHRFHWFWSQVALLGTVWVRGQNWQFAVWKEPLSDRYGSLCTTRRSIWEHSRALWYSCAGTRSRQIRTITRNLCPSAPCETFCSNPAPIPPSSPFL